MRRMLTYAAMISAAAGLLLTKAPHIRLASDLMSGRVDGRPVPVTSFVAETFQEKCVPVRYGELRFELPERATVEPVSPDGRAGLLLKWDGLMCRILPLRHPSGEEALAERNGEAMDGRDELERRIAICTASDRELSFWMNAFEIERLRERLESRPAVRLSAERVEVVRGPTLSGLLLVWKVEGSPRLVFSYFSPGDRTAGTVFLFLDSDSAGAWHAARALLGTFHLEIPPEGPAR